MKIDESKTYIPCFDKADTKAEQLDNTLFELDMLPSGYEIIQEGTKILVCPSEIEIEEDLPLTEIYKQLRDKLVNQAEYILEKFKNTEPTTKEEWEQLVQEWEKE